MKIALTGHRSEDCETERVVRAKFRASIEPYGVDVLLCGMANGFDLWAGSEAVRMGIPVVACRPWTGHGPRRGDVELYAEVITHAAKVVNVNASDRYLGPWMYHDRNHYMVDNADALFYYWNGKTSGGTWACMEYADDKGMQMYPVRSAWIDPEIV